MRCTKQGLDIGSSVRLLAYRWNGMYGRPSRIFVKHNLPARITIATCLCGPFQNKCMASIRSSLQHDGNSSLSLEVRFDARCSQPMLTAVTCGAPTPFHSVPQPSSTKFIMIAYTDEKHHPSRNHQSIRGDYASRAFCFWA